MPPSNKNPGVVIKIRMFSCCWTVDLMGKAVKKVLLGDRDLVQVNGVYKKLGALDIQSKITVIQ